MGGEGGRLAGKARATGSMGFAESIAGREAAERGDDEEGNAGGGRRTEESYGERKGQQGEWVMI